MIKDRFFCNLSVFMKFIVNFMFFVGLHWGVMAESSIPVKLDDFRNEQYSWVNLCYVIRIILRLINLASLHFSSIYDYGRKRVWARDVINLPKYLMSGSLIKCVGCLTKLSDNIAFVQWVIISTGLWANKQYWLRIKVPLF